MGMGRLLRAGEAMTERGALLQIRAVLQALTADPRTQLEAIDGIVSEVLNDPVRLVASHAMKNPQPKGVVPHHLRCDALQGQKRCRLQDGHLGTHVFEKVLT